MTLAGELVLSRNELNEAISKEDQISIKASGQRINQVTSELQEAIMLTRMQNIGNIFNKFPRIVRDMAIKQKKEIKLNISGKEVELDKTIIEGLNEPLMHMIRNAVDHGIELPDNRIKQEKDPKGEINLKAFHEAGQVIIEISDDGKGLDINKITSSAVSRGIILKEELKEMTQKEKLALIFKPGLTTAKSITDVSGRGVGMDVVKSNLDKLGGIIDIDTLPGKGSTFKIKLPLTLAIIPSLLISVNNERFVIPQLNVEELIRISVNDIKKKIENIGNIEVLNLRGKLIPLVHLADILGIIKTYKEPLTDQRELDRRNKVADRRIPTVLNALSETNESNIESDIETEQIKVRKERRYQAQSDLNIVIVSSGFFRYGLIVEKLYDNMEIVIKPLGRHLKKCLEYAGATIMGDGRVALIIDIAGIANLAAVNTLQRNIASEEKELIEEKETHSYLLFRNSPEEHCAMPINLVDRVEHITADKIENVGGRRVMQYRGKSLPLVRLEDAATCTPLKDDQQLAVIVFKIKGHEIGLLGSRPTDSIETDIEIDSTSLKQRGVLGSAIINGFTTMIVDVFAIVEVVYPDWVSHLKKEEIHTHEKSGKTILVVEDSNFFRTQLLKILNEAGFNTIGAEDGQLAWEILKSRADDINIVLTDIEMPNMDGYELTKKIRADNRFSSIPIIAITSVAGDENIKKGKALGITEYQIKLDREKLLESIKKYITLDDS